ncbi:hypothetical protein GCM10027275_41970 [Rhabdobacter roseus]|uniref:Beta-mannosidase-like galactose-binding domain-containing protein n=1 Tax=Rhabdobacter roseus TaxID=1655419 RepID=A0A840TTE8_9BACT|nr:glycosyl hydrolase [Rhabdobacter roseus]MBB5286175.1 hypothetical protein [Rhabdobacter roseus]
MSLFLKKKIFSCAYVLALAGLVVASCSRTSTEKKASLAELKKGFLNPTGTARAKVYWWWLNGYTDTLRLREELHAIKEAGLGGVDLFEIGLPPASDPNQLIPAGPAFMSDSSLRAIAFALREAKKLDLEVGFNLASSWNAGGSWVEPKHAAKTLYFSKTTLTPTVQGTLSLPFPTIPPDRQGRPRAIVYGPDGKPAYYEEVAVIAVPAGARNLADTSGIQNISNYFNPKTETLSWQAPAGTWDIYRYVCSNSGEQLLRPSPRSAGPILDHFDSSATRMHVTYFLDRLQPLVGDFKTSALKYLYLASYEAKDFAWTPTLPAKFRELHGYDIYKYLPAVYDQEVFSTPTTERFNYDFAKTYSELMIQNHYRKAKEICNQHGLQIISESGGPGHMHHIPVETLKALGSLDVPRGEFWYKRPYYDKDSVDMVWLVKEIAAASHIYKRGIVEEEAFTSYWDWQEAPADLKVFADRAFCEGMNRLVIHGFTHNPREMGFPGIAYFAGTHYNDRRVWWPQVKPFNDYLARISYLLQQAQFQADVLYYYGDDIPNLVPPKNTRFKVGDGYDYEIVNTEILLRDLTVENGEWVLPGVGRYQVLSLGKGHRANPQAAAKIKALQAKGGIVAGDDIRASLSVPPDFSYQDADKGTLDYIHYATHEADFYLVRNTTDAWVSREVGFRQVGKVPELWDPTSGQVVPVSIFDQREKHIQVPLTLAPFEAYFVVFSKQKVPAHYTAVGGAGAHPPLLRYTPEGVQFLEKGVVTLKKGNQEESLESTPTVQPLEGTWSLRFPADSVAATTLQSWTDFDAPDIKYFAGTGTYQKTFDGKSTPPGQRTYLDLGDVAEVATLWLNGQRVGTSWAPPHRFDVTALLREGTNQLRVEVANTESNRLTGDALTGTQFTKTNIVKANKNLTPWGEVPLKKSGLLGPVTLQGVKTFSPRAE